MIGEGIGLGKRLVDSSRRLSDRRGYRFREAVGVIGEGVGLGK